MRVIRKTGCAIAILGVITFVIAGYIFSSSGVSPDVKTVGELSLVLWLPIVIAGIVLFLVGEKKGDSRERR